MAFAIFFLIEVFLDLGKYTDRWVAGHAVPCAIICWYMLICEAICCFGMLEAAAVSGDPGHRVNESTPRAAATTREARTPTGAQHDSRVLETLPQPAYYVGQTAGALFLSSVSCGKQKKNSSEQQTMRSQHTCGSRVGVENSDNAAEL